MFGILDQQIVPTASKGNAHNMVFKLREIYSIQKSPFVAQMFVSAKTISSDFTSGVWKASQLSSKERTSIEKYLLNSSPKSFLTIEMKGGKFFCRYSGFMRCRLGCKSSI